MSVKDLTIAEIQKLAECLQVPSVSIEAESLTKDRGVCIVVLQRGWVVVGHVREEGDDLTVTNAAVCRYWGTDKGLGQLAEEGPLADSKMDDCGDIRTHRLTVIMVMDCNQEKWHDRN